MVKIRFVYHISMMRSCKSRGVALVKRYYLVVRGQHSRDVEFPRSHEDGFLFPPCQMHAKIS